MALEEQQDEAEQSFNRFGLWLAILAPYYFVIIVAGFVGWNTDGQSDDKLRLTWFQFFSALANIYSMPFLGAADTISDIVLVHEMYKEGALGVATLSLGFILIHAAISSVLTYRGSGSSSLAIAQFLQLRVFYEVWQSCKVGRALFELQQLKMWETVFESFPELILTLYYFLQYELTADPFILLTMIFSSVSIAKSMNFQDQYGLKIDSVLYSWPLLLYRFCEIVNRVFLVGIFATYISAPAAFTYLFLITCVSIGLKFYYDDEPKRDRSFYVQAAILNVMCFDYNDLPSSTIMNRMKVFEAFVFFVCLVATQSFDIAPIIWIPWIAIIIFVFFSFPLFFASFYDLDGYIAARNIDVEMLLERNKIELLFSLVRRRVIPLEKRMLDQALKKNKFGGTDFEVYKISERYTVVELYDKMGIRTPEMFRMLGFRFYRLADMGEDCFTKEELILAGYPKQAVLSYYQNMKRRDAERKIKDKDKKRRRKQKRRKGHGHKIEVKENRYSDDDSDAQIDSPEATGPRENEIGADDIYKEIMAFGGMGDEDDELPNFPSMDEVQFTERGEMSLGDVTKISYTTSDDEEMGLERSYSHRKKKRRRRGRGQRPPSERERKTRTKRRSPEFRHQRNRQEEQQQRREREPKISDREEKEEKTPDKEKKCKHKRQSTMDSDEIHAMIWEKRRQLSLRKKNSEDASTKEKLEAKYESSKSESKIQEQKNKNIRNENNDRNENNRNNKNRRGYKSKVKSDSESAVEKKKSQQKMRQHRGNQNQYRNHHNRNKHKDHRGSGSSRRKESSQKSRTREKDIPKSNSLKLREKNKTKEDVPLRKSQSENHGSRSNTSGDKQKRYSSRTSQRSGMKVEIPEHQDQDRRSLLDSLRKGDRVVSRSDDRSPTESYNSPTYSAHEYSYDYSLTSFSQHRSSNTYSGRRNHNSSRGYHEQAEMQRYIESELIVE